MNKQLIERSIVINSYMRNNAMNPLFKDVSAVEIRRMLHKTYPTIFTKDFPSTHFEITLIEAHIELSDKNRNMVSAQQEQSAAEIKIFNFLNESVQLPIDITFPRMDMPHQSKFGTRAT